VNISDFSFRISLLYWNSRFFRRFWGCLPYGLNWTPWLL